MRKLISASVEFVVGQAQGVGCWELSLGAEPCLLVCLSACLSTPLNPPACGGRQGGAGPLSPCLLVSLSPCLLVSLSPCLSDGRWSVVGGRWSLGEDERDGVGGALGLGGDELREVLIV